MKYNVNFLSPRQSGKTTILAKAVKEAEGVLICANSQQAEAIARHHGIQAISLSNLESLIGNKKPAVFDNSAVEEMQREYEKEIRELRLRIDVIKGKIYRVTHILGDAYEV